MRWRERFAEFASIREDDAGIAGWSPSGLDTRFRFFRRHWDEPAPGSRFLDLGCGAGTYTRWLAEQRLSAIGVDYSPVALVKATARSPATIPYCAADASALPFADGAFDGILCFGVLQAVSDSRPFVVEAARVLRSGGELWIDALNAGGLAARFDAIRRWMRGKPMHLRYETAPGLRRILHEAGFRSIDQYWLVIVPGKVAFLQPWLETGPSRWMIQRVPGIGPLLGHSIVFRARKA